MAPWIYSRYRPSAKDGYLEYVPISSDLPFQLPDSFRLPLETGRLSWSWGRERLAVIRYGASATHSLEIPKSRQGFTGEQKWDISLPARAGQFNYLAIRMQRRSDRPYHNSWTRVSLYVDADGILSPEATPVTIDVSPDETPQTYLIPIGCSPDWAWQPAGASLAITTGRDDLQILSGKLFMYDDARQ